MTNEEMLLRAILGQTLPEDETFHPQTNEQAYLAYAVGLITDPNLLPEPRTNEEVFLREYCLNGGGGGGGIVLPELFNPASGFEILEGYDAIDENGEVVYGNIEDNSRKRMQVQVDLESGTASVPRGFHDGITGVRLDVEEKTVTPSDVEQEITPSRGAVLGKVIVSPAASGEELTALLKAIITRDGGEILNIPAVGLIGDYAFYKTDFSEVNIPDSVGAIGQYAFAEMPNLAAIVIPSNVMEIGHHAFYNDRPLTDIKIDGPATIGEYAFSGNDGYIYSLVVPRVTSIGNYAFQKQCLSGFDTLDLSSVETIGDKAFMVYSMNSDVKNVLLPVVKSIGTGAFEGVRMEYVSMPNVETIGTEAFKECRSLVQVDVGNKVTSIGEYAFQEAGFETIILPDSLLTIGKCAFYNVPLKTVVIPENVTSIGEYPFYSCDELLSVTYNATAASGGNKAWGYNNVTSFTIGDNVLKVPMYLCASTKISSIDLPYGLQEIGSQAFANCNNLTEFTIPETVTKYGTYICNGCTALTTLNYNAINATNGGSYTAIGTSTVTEINIGGSVEVIPYKIFDSCSSVPMVDLPASVRDIKSAAFNKCSALAKLIVRSNSVVTLSNKDALTSTAIASGTGYIYVPDELVDSYKTATNWVTYAAQIKPISELEV